MTRIVVDTNVLIRYLIRPSNAVRTLIETLWLGGIVQMVSAPEIIAELEDVLSRDKLRRYISAEDGNVLLTTVAQLAEILLPLGEVPSYSRDPKDDKFIACALLGQVEYLISLDLDLLVLEHIGDIAIVTPERFLAELSSST